MGIKRIVLSGGGEPIARPGLVMQIAERKKGIEGIMVTNGTLFTDDMIRQLAEDSWDVVQVSLDGPDAETQDYLRGSGTYDIIIKNIMRFSYWKKNLSRDRPAIEIFPVICNANHDKVLDFLALAVRLGLEFVTFQPMRVPGNEAGKSLSLSAAQQSGFSRNVKSGIEYAKKHGLKTNLESFDEKVVERGSDLPSLIKDDMKHSGMKGRLEDLPCYMPWIELTIKPDGMAGPCPPSIDMIGESISQMSLKEIWTGKKSQSLREMLAKGGLPGCCQRCCGNLILENRLIRNNI
jgi:MoaA/NifB/PqqE/SkfB family radical SAM enzyme